MTKHDVIERFFDGKSQPFTVVATKSFRGKRKLLITIIRSTARTQANASYFPATDDIIINLSQVVSTTLEHEGLHYVLEKPELDSDDSVERYAKQRAEVQAWYESVVDKNG